MLIKNLDLESGRLIEVSAYSRLGAESNKYGMLSQVALIFFLKELHHDIWSQFLRKKISFKCEETLK